MSSPLEASAAKVQQASWNEFRQAVAAQKLRGRGVRVVVSSGSEINTRLLEVTETHLVVRAKQATALWDTADKQARIPKEQVKSVRFKGRVGRGRLIGTLVGAGAGGGLAAAATTGNDVNEGTFAILIPAAAAAIVAIGTVSGYFIGRAVDHRAPEFILTP
jgi:hypothetical protein